MSKIRIRSVIDLLELVDELRCALSPEEAIAFILDLDERYADYHFTEELYARLGDALREELGSDAG